MRDTCATPKCLLVTGENLNDKGWMPIGDPTAKDQQMLKSLVSVNSDFKMPNIALIDHMEKEDEQLLSFIDLRAQASCSAHKKSFAQKPHVKLSSHIASAESENKCVACKTERHPLYLCAKFKTMSHEDKHQLCRANRVCTNCLGVGHFKTQCKFVHRCKTCQRAHHTLLHRESAPVKFDTEPPAPSQAVVTVGSTPAATALCSNLLFMTCRVLIKAPDGSLTEARALLDNASCASFISERLAQSLSLHRKHVPVSVSGIGGLSHKPPLQSVTTFEVQSLSGRKIEVITVIVPKVTCDLPTAPIAFDLRWNHLDGLPLADPSVGQPGRVDMLLGADIFVNVLRDGRRKGPDDAPTAFETDFGWVLCGCIQNGEELVAP